MVQGDKEEFKRKLSERKMNRDFVCRHVFRHVALIRKYVDAFRLSPQKSERSLETAEFGSNRDQHRHRLTNENQSTAYSLPDTFLRYSWSQDMKKLEMS
jgi:hypothetical protein